MSDAPLIAQGRARRDPTAVGSNSDRRSNESLAIRLAGAAIGFTIPLVAWIVAHWLVRVGPPHPTFASVVRDLALIGLVAGPAIGFVVGPKAIATQRPWHLVAGIALVAPLVALLLVGTLVLAVELLGLTGWPTLLLLTYLLAFVPAWVIAGLILLPAGAFLVFSLRYLRANGPSRVLALAVAAVLASAAVPTAADAVASRGPVPAGALPLSVAVINRSAADTGVDLGTDTGGPSTWRPVPACSFTTFATNAAADWELRIMTRLQRDDPGAIRALTWPPRSCAGIQALATSSSRLRPTALSAATRGPRPTWCRCRRADPRTGSARAPVIHRAIALLLAAAVIVSCDASIALPSPMLTIECRLARAAAVIRDDWQLIARATRASDEAEIERLYGRLGRDGRQVMDIADEIKPPTDEVANASSVCSVRARGIGVRSSSITSARTTLPSWQSPPLNRSSRS